MVAFPDLFHAGNIPADGQQVSMWFWSIWHAVFPTVVAISALYDPSLALRIVSRAATRKAVWITVVATLSLAGLLGATVFGARSALPHLVQSGHYEIAFIWIVCPTLAALNILACALLLRRGKKLTTLQLWLCVAMITATLDVLLNMTSASRYSYGWYIGKLETVVTASAVLGILLCEFAREITLQKQSEVALQKSEARYRFMANAMPQIAFTAGLDGALDYVNERWLKYTGLSLEQSSQQGGLPVTHPEDRERVRVAWRESIANGQEYETEQRLRCAADGRYRWHLIRAVPIPDTDGRILQWLGTGTDIDDQKRAEAEIARARDEALHAATMKSQFVATMSHEIRTPMSGVIGMNELLLLTPLNETQREYATVARDSGQSLLRVINDILDFSKLDAGKLDIELVEFDVASQIKSVADLLQNHFAQKGVTLSSPNHADVPGPLLGDPGRLRQILVNLVGNALKFTPVGGVVGVDATSLPGEAGRSLIRFTIRDSGIGIAPEAQTRLFEPFSQADGSTTRKFGGTGLGLSISKQLVALMGGTIGVDSVAGKGACFWFCIPFLHSNSAQRDVPLAIRKDEQRANRRTRSEKILLVEDNHVNTMLAKMQCKHLGFEIATAANGREALEAVQAEQFDLILMDRHMPDMDGFEVTRKIRALEAGRALRVPIVAMTADAQSEAEQACLAAGMDDFLSKPCTIANLGTVFDRWLLASPTLAFPVPVAYGS